MDDKIRVSFFLAFGEYKDKIKGTMVKNYDIGSKANETTYDIKEMFFYDFIDYF